MRKELFAATMLVLAAGTGMAQGRPEPPTPAFHVPGMATVGHGTEPLPPGGMYQPPPTAPLQDCPPCPEEPAAAGRCGPAGRVWLRGEYLLWWTQGSRLPPLVTTGLPGATPFPGALGQAGTRVIYGDSDLESGPRSGGRFTGGFWCDPCQRFGLEGSYFFLAPRDTRFDAVSDATLGSALIARPFFDVITGAQNAQLVAFPLLGGGTNLLTATGSGLASGEVHASSSSRLQGGEINALCCVCSGCNYWMQALAGFRYLDLDEGLAISETTRVNPALPPGSPFFGGSTITMTDQFDTSNRFYGGQVGLRGEVRSGRMFVEVQGKVALGVTRQVVDVHGSTAITPPGGAAVVTPVGFLASGSNSGRFERDEFSVVPEVGVNVGYRVTDHLRVFVGYNFLYWSSVVRPADQIDVGLSGTQIPTDTRFNPAAGPARPGVLVRDSGFWVQGVSFGAEVGF